MKYIPLMSEPSLLFAVNYLVSSFIGKRYQTLHVPVPCGALVILDRGSAVGKSLSKSWSDDQVNETLVPLVRTDIIEVLDMHAHELAYALNGCKNRFCSEFEAIALAVRLQVKMRWRGSVQSQERAVFLD